MLYTKKLTHKSNEKNNQIKRKVLKFIKNHKYVGKIVCIVQLMSDKVMSDKKTPYHSSLYHSYLLNNVKCPTYCRLISLISITYQ
jgi:hypothetical protein